MRRFDPASFQMPCGHFIGGRLVEAAAAHAVHRPSDGRPHAALRSADASTVSALQAQRIGSIVDAAIEAGARPAS